MSNNIPADKTTMQRFFSSTKLLVIAIVIATLAGFGIMYSIAKGISSPVGSACTVAACVPISKHNSQPQVVTVANGSFVQFNSADGEKHEIMLAHSGSEHTQSQHSDSHYSSGEFAADEGWKVQFKQDGTYSFTDMNNENVKISVVVYTPGKDYKVN